MDFWTPIHIEALGLLIIIVLKNAKDKMYCDPSSIEWNVWVIVTCKHSFRIGKRNCFFFLIIKGIGTQSVNFETGFSAWKGKIINI